MNHKALNISLDKAVLCICHKANTKLIEKHLNAIALKWAPGEIVDVFLRHFDQFLVK